jgi:hypothetical protein
VSGTTANRHDRARKQRSFLGRSLIDGVPGA